MTRDDFIKSNGEVDYIAYTSYLEMTNKSLRGEIKVHAEKSNNRYKAIKDLEKHISRLQLECQKYFDWFMGSQQENQALIKYLEDNIKYQKTGLLWTSNKRLKVYQDILERAKSGKYE